MKVNTSKMIRHRFQGGSTSFMGVLSVGNILFCFVTHDYQANNNVELKHIIDMFMCDLWHGVCFFFFRLLNIVSIYQA